MKAKYSLERFPLKNAFDTESLPIKAMSFGGQPKTTDDENVGLLRRIAGAVLGLLVLGLSSKAAPEGNAWPDPRARVRF